MTSRRQTRQLRAASRFHLAAARAILSFLSELTQLDIAPPRQRLVSALRGYAPRPQLVDIRALGEFGVFKDLPVAWVEQRLDQLLEEGFVELSPGTDDRRPPRFGLRIATPGRRLLEASDASALRILRAPPQLPPAELSPRDRVLTALLLELRSRVGRLENRPAFSILPNATVDAIVQARPTNLGDLAGITGMGPERVRKYGRRILGAIGRSKR